MGRQRRIHPRLPALPRRAELLQHVHVEAQADHLFRGRPLRAAAAPDGFRGVWEDFRERLGGPDLFGSPFRILFVRDAVRLVPSHTVRLSLRLAYRRLMIQYTSERRVKIAL
jgi:hypothetical protein